MWDIIKITISISFKQIIKDTPEINSIYNMEEVCNSAIIVERVSLGFEVLLSSQQLSNLAAVTAHRCILVFSLSLSLSLSLPP